MGIKNIIGELQVNGSKVLTEAGGSALGTKVTLAQLQANIQTYALEGRVIRLVLTNPSHSEATGLKICVMNAGIVFVSPSPSTIGSYYRRISSFTCSESLLSMDECLITIAGASAKIFHYEREYTLGDTSSSSVSNHEYSLSDSYCDFYVI
jgi:hypothetical protein